MSNQRKTKKRSGRRVAPGDAPFGLAEDGLAGPVGRGPRAIVKTIIGGVALVGIAFGLAYAVHEYVKRTPLFAATEMAVAGARRLSKEQVLSQAGLRLGQNILSVDTAHAERELLKSPWVRSAAITRRLPGSVRVEIEEREARAKGLIGDRVFLISEEGEPFKEVEPSEAEDLPLISGIEATMLGRDSSAEIRRLVTSVELLDEYEHSALGAELAAEELHWDPAGQAVLTIGRTGTALHLGSPPFRAKLARAERVLADARSEGTIPAVVFLDNEAHPERVVVRAR